MVRHARQDRNFMAIGYPAPTVFMGSAGWRVDFRWEIVADEEDPHA